jgi:hypothetical protein
MEGESKTRSTEERSGIESYLYTRLNASTLLHAPDSPSSHSLTTTNYNIFSSFDQASVCLSSIDDADT